MSATAAFLVRSAREFRRGGYVFTGFHWPVLAGRLAHRLPGQEFRIVYEAGAVTIGPGASTPTSTTDYPAYAASITWRGGLLDTLLAFPARYDRVVLDAANVDLRGRINSSLIGPVDRPTVRLPGGGGAADVCGRAGELVVLHGGTDPTRICRAVEHVTAAPPAHATVILHTRWGVVRLGDRPSLYQVCAGPDVAPFVSHLHSLGVEVDRAAPVEPVDATELEAARAVLAEAADRGYRVAGPALREPR